MKTKTEKNQAVDAIDAAIEKERKNLFIAGGGAYFSESEGALKFDVELWREGTRPMTEAGRAELAAEEAAIERVLAVARQFGEVVDDGDGFGQYGQISCYRVEFENE